MLLSIRWNIPATRTATCVPVVLGMWISNHSKNGLACELKKAAQTSKKPHVPNPNVAIDFVWGNAVAITKIEEGINVDTDCYSI